jgi:hypothetical protein
MGQTQHLRSFGNYITLQHEDGEFSHYAHLAKGTFQVRNGQKVEQGQALALAGNSGYTFGQGGGTHLHVHVTRSFPIASQSIPFRFEELEGPPRRLTSRRVVSSNTSPLCVCQTRGVPGAPGAGPAGPAEVASYTGSVPVTHWWERVVPVPRGAPRLEVELAWDAGDSDLDLHLMSPSGKHYGWYGLTQGYSGKEARPETFSIVSPEPGSWRIAVRAMRGGPGDVAFRVETALGPRSAARGGAGQP